MCAEGGHRQSAVFLFMRDTRGNELFGMYYIHERSLRKLGGARASRFSSPVSPFAQCDANWIRLGLGQCESVFKKRRRKFMRILKELSRCTISVQHYNYNHNSQNYMLHRLMNSC